MAGIIYRVSTNVTLEYSVNNKELAELSLGNEEDRLIHVAGIIPGDIVITVKAGRGVIAKKDAAYRSSLPNVAISHRL